MPVLLLALCIMQGGAVAQELVEPPHETPEIQPHTALLIIESFLDENDNLHQGSVTALKQPVRMALEHLKVGRAEQTLGAIDRFSNHVNVHVRSGLLEVKDAKFLATLAQSASDSLTLALRPPERIIAPLDCNETLPCDEQPLFVVKQPEPEGVQDSFPSVAAALKQAEKLDLACVHVRVDEGLFEEGILEITRDVRIVGAGRFRTTLAGSVLNLDGHRLDIESLTLQDSPAPGAVFVDGPCAVTTLRNVQIREPRGYGLWQWGGTVLLRNGLIWNTRSAPGDNDSGTAIYLDGGADACLHNFLSAANGGGVLTAAGHGTRVHANRITSWLNEVNPDALTEVGAEAPGATHGLGVIEVREGALLLSELSTMMNEEFVGLHVHQHGRAHWRYGTIENVRTRRAGGLPFGGFCAASRDEGELQLTGFALRRAFVGLTVQSHGTVRASHGDIALNEIGASVLEPGSPLFCLRDNVRYINNRISLDAGLDFPLPDHPPGETPPPPDFSLCADVPFSPVWCK